MVPASRAVRIDMALQWVMGSPQDAIGTAARVMRPCVEVAIREALVELVPDCAVRLRRQLDAMRRAA